ncbi:hypothetical protein LCGC14_2153470 [marine sediment metagenome]|uniref:Uncharacterized protein n=1 Tax=marine sediment metagenome TaxID=412755 RepID=A0A0F9G7V1_9ZZZZ
MSLKSKSGSHRKVDTARHRKRQKRERGNREKRESARIHAEAEFAQRIRKEPSLKEVIGKEG